MTLELETTGIGSLPFTEVQDAVDHVFSSYTIPFYPQLPKHRQFTSSKAAQMLQEVVPPQVLELLSKDVKPDLVRLDASWTVDLAGFPGIDLFRDRLNKSEARYFKLQLAGPQTALAALEFFTGFAPEKEIQALLTRKIIALGELLINYLRTESKICIFLWDEMLPTPQTIGSKNFLLDLLQIEIQNKVISGIHNCAPLKPEVFRPYGLGRYLAADLSQIALEDPDNIYALQNTVKNGGIIAGVVDTQKTSIDQKLTEKRWQIFKRIIARVPGLTKKPLILSGGCGTGLHTIDFEIALAKVLRTLQQ